MIADALKTKTLELRKTRDPMATFLIAVGSKAKDLAKAENPTAETFGDEHALRAINSYVKGAEDNLALLAANPESPTYVRAAAEREMLKSFLPQEASEAEVRAVVEEIIDNSRDLLGPKMGLMGGIMAALTEKFGAALNKKEASALVKSMLSK
ncbi:Yqey-like protein [compost metagenome]